ncbi:DUF896 domain-containing protein [Peptacetobacter sp.]|uniref:DUF896 domain-containing protein n=1 Tax=unclassified Peptacetobacter TaxID=2991974 RepID=UPI00261F8C78|nr:DUF896 domain-containing protein [Peptacetobacter sp.]MEE0450630.1 DUF896 domain-containing protein [Peptacetobacter sp.]
MIDQKLINRINELAKKNKAEGLTPAETKEREKLRKIYLQEFKKGFKQRLDSIEVVSPEEFEKRTGRKPGKNGSIYEVKDN